MSLDIKDVLDLEIKREQEIINRLKDLQLDEQSKQEVRWRTYQSYKSIQQGIELFNA